MRVALLLAGIASLPAFADGPPDQPQTCGDIETYHALDFWVGDWQVYSDGRLVGTDVIEKILAGCAVLENWTGAGGGQGKSLFYVDDRGTWQQVWVTERAMVPGGVKEKTWQPLPAKSQVRFQGVISRRGGADYLDRTTLTRREDGTVRQLIEVSTDGGRSWQTTFDADYRPRQDDQQ